MANAAIAYINLFDTATTIVTSSAGSSTPGTNLQNPHVSIKWRGTGGTTDNFEAQWTSDQTADTFMVCGIGTNFLATGTVRLELFDSFGAHVYDSGTVAGIVDPKYGYCIHLLSQSYTFRYARWTFTQAGASYIEAGRAFVGLRTTLTYNYVPGASFAPVDPSKWTDSAAGGVFVDPRVTYRDWQVTFSWVTEAQYRSFIEPLDMTNGSKTDVLFIRDPADSNLGQVSVWGLMRLAATLQPFEDGTLYSKSFQFRERRA